MKVTIPIPSYIENVISILENGSHQAFIVGGCVRDSIMGREPSDWDITTSALPEETKECFKEYKTLDTGIKHGTVTVLTDSRVVEITTFRKEEGYSDNRHPDRVNFVKDIESDLSRRDFTVNAMAYNPKTGLADPFSGQEDIEKKVIRCVGDGEKRFTEDALRIMRALRFSSVLGFEIEEETSRCIHKLKGLLKNVSAERLRDELMKLLSGKDAYRVLKEYDDVFFTLIPELEKEKGTEQNCVYHIYDVWEHTLTAVREADNDPVLRLTMMLHDIAKPRCKVTDEKGIDHFPGHAAVGADMAFDILKGLKFDNKTISTVTKLVLHHDDRVYNDLKKLPLYVAEFGFDFCLMLDRVSRADTLGQNKRFFNVLEKCDKYIEELEKLRSSGLCLDKRDLEITGSDLRKLGYEGREIGKKFDEIFEKVLLRELDNDKEKLLEYASKRTDS